MSHKNPKTSVMEDHMSLSTMNRHPLVCDFASHVAQMRVTNLVEVFRRKGVAGLSTEFLEEILVRSNELCGDCCVVAVGYHEECECELEKEIEEEKEKKRERTSLV